MLDEITCEAFAECLGNSFILELDGNEVAIELVESTELSETPVPGQERKPFSIIFQVLAGAAVPQGTHRVQHERLGNLELFLVPVFPSEQGPRLEAVFT